MKALIVNMNSYLNQHFSHLSLLKLPSFSVVLKHFTWLGVKRFNLVSALYFLENLI